LKKSVIILLVLIFLLTACSKNAANVSLNQLPENYNLDDAKSDNCVVFENSDITYGQSAWDDFITVTDKGKSSTVRLAFYYTLGEPSQYSEEYYKEIKDNYPVLYIKDLSFDGKKYIIEGFEDGKLISKEYKYLVKYEGRPNSATAIFSKYTYYVLVNDNSVTWGDIEHRMLSSRSGDWIEHYIVYSDLVL
jgi:major membrane immunogen (membrane-anchored lipoprotein)